MKSNAEVLHTFDQKELKAKQENAKGFYMSRLDGYDSSEGRVTKGAIKEFQFRSVDDALKGYVQLLADGFTQSNVQTVAMQGPLGTLVQVYLNKPAKEQNADLKALYVEVEAEYRAEIEELNAKIVERQVQLMLEQEERKAAEETARLKSEREAALRAEVLAALAPSV